MGRKIGIGFASLSCWWRCRQGRRQGFPWSAAMRSVPMRSFLLSLVLGVSALGLLGATPSEAQAQRWRRFYGYSPGTAYYPGYSYYAPAYSSYYYPGYSAYSYGYPTYYGGYSTYYAPGYSTYS